MSGSLTQIAVATLSMAIAGPAFAALAAGAPAPDFSVEGVQAETSAPLHLSDMLSRGPVVIFFLPHIYSSAGAAECRAFADAIDAFSAAGATVIGMSRDPADALGRFSAEHCAGKIAMASADLAIVTAFDVNDSANFATRTTYVVAPSGEITFVHDAEDPIGHVSSTLAFVQSMRNTARSAQTRSGGDFD